MKCFYHSADLDGHASGAIVKYTHADAEMVGINYSDAFPWETLTDRSETVFMVDFSLQPEEEMVRLHQSCQLIWIDHHKTALDALYNLGLAIEGNSREGIGACALVWEYLHRLELMPHAIHLLAEYDVWDHHREETLPFQYGMRLRNTWPEHQELWNPLFATYDSPLRKAITDEGHLCLRYQNQQNEGCLKAYGFETTFEGLRAIACNRGFTNSQLFDARWNPEKYDLMITFCRLPLPKRLWTVSLYSTKPDVACGSLAKRYGGGGHNGAAGFQCETLPFDY